MEVRFAVKSMYEEAMFYHQLAASMPKKQEIEKKRFRLPPLGYQELVLLPFMLFVFYSVFQDLPVLERTVQSATAAFLAWGILKFNRKHQRQVKEKKAGEKDEKTTLKEQARALFANSLLDGDRCSLEFYEEGFQLENSGIKTWYEYEGIAWIKETSKYVILFWNRSMSVPVEKAGIHRGNAAQFPAFLEKHCGKKIEKVRVEE
ncbi:MAG: YcxB family protein [Lachnospiraceae bacterium]|nr:YcxB family protein [Lachnospiraceae bacterium]